MKRILLLICALFALGASAQLRKAASVEKIKSWQVGHVQLLKVSEPDGTVNFCISLTNIINNKLPNIILVMGDYDHLVSNLEDFASSLEHGKDNDLLTFDCESGTFDFIVDSQLGSACFAIKHDYRSEWEARFFLGNMKQMLKWLDSDEGKKLQKYGTQYKRVE